MLGNVDMNIVLHAFLGAVTAVQGNIERFVVSTENCVTTLHLLNITTKVQCQLKTLENHIYVVTETGERGQILKI